MGNKTPKEISKDTKIKDESLSGGATDLTTQTTKIMLHTNDETKVEVAKNDDDDEFFDTLDTADNDSNIDDTAAASKAANDDTVSALSGDTTFYDIMRETKLQCFPTMEAVTPIVEHIKFGRGITCASRGPSTTDFVCMNAVSIWAVVSKFVSPADNQMECLWSQG